MSGIKKTKNHEKFDYEDYFYNKEGKKLVRKIADEKEARGLIRRYEGLFESKKDLKDYDKWRKQEADKGIDFTPDQWKSGDDEY